MEVPEGVRETLELMLEACQESGSIDKAQMLREKSTWGRDLLWLAAFAPANYIPLSQSVLAGEILRQQDLVSGVDRDFAFEAIVAILRQARKEEENMKIAEMVVRVAVKCGPIVDRLARFLHENITPESDLDVLLLIRCYGSLISSMHHDRSAQLEMFHDLVELVSVWLNTDTVPPAIQTVVLSTLRPWLLGWKLLPDDGMFYLLNRAAQIMGARVSQLLSSAGQMSGEAISALLQCASACEDFISDFSREITGRKKIPEEYGRIIEFLGEYFTWAYKNLPDLYPMWRPSGFPTATLRTFEECLPFVIEARKDEPEFAGQICRIVTLYGEYFDEELFQTDAWGFWTDAYEYGGRGVVEQIYGMLLRANPVFAVRGLAENVNGCEEAVVFLLRSAMPIIEKSENAEAQGLYREFVCRLLSEDINKCNHRNLLSTMFLLGARTIELLPPEIAGRWGEAALATVMGAVRERVVTNPVLVTASAAFEYLYEWLGKEKRELDGEFVEAILHFHLANPLTSKPLELIASRGSLESRVKLVQQCVVPVMIAYLEQEENSWSDEARFKGYCWVLNDILRSAGPDVIPQGMPEIFRRVIGEDDTTCEVLNFLSTFSLIIKDPRCWMEYLCICRDEVSWGMAWGNEVGSCMSGILSRWGHMRETREVVLSILLMLINDAARDAANDDLDMLDCVPVTTALCLVIILGRRPPDRITEVQQGISVLRKYFLRVRDEEENMRALACLSLMELDIVCLYCSLARVDMNEVVELIDYCWQNGLFVTHYHRRLFSVFCKMVSSQPPIPRLVAIQEEIRQGRMNLNRQFVKNFEEYLSSAIYWKPPAPPPS